MKELGSFLLLLLLVVSGIWFYRKYKANEREKAEAEAEKARKQELYRLSQFDFFKQRIDSIRIANDSFKTHLELNNGYFTNSSLVAWKSKYNSLHDEIRAKPYEDIQLFQEDITLIKMFKNFFTNANSLRDDFNKAFVKEELQTFSSFFDDIENRKLDLQQRTAVVTDEDNNIVIAGAGSGKTTTIVGKINYLISRYGVSPKEILLISFTKKSALDLAERINLAGLDAMTFHKFGKEVIVQVDGKQPSVFDEAQFNLLIKKYFNQSIQNENYLQKVTEYFSDFLKPVKSQFEFEDRGEYIQYIKDQNFRSYKLKEVKVNGRITFSMEAVKSIEECKIANFLLFNGINYDYELPYEHDTANQSYRRYKPDFTIIQGGNKIYLEHFGIKRDGSVPKWFSGDGYQTASEKYNEDMNWKRETHKNYGTTLIETYSYEMSEGGLFENLTKKLVQAGIVLKPKSPDEIWKIISEASKEEVDNFISLFATFITLMKSNNYSVNEVKDKNKQIKDIFTRGRNSLFLELLTPIYSSYQSYLTARDEIDFSDMINKASLYISSGKYKRRFKYVIIDEFQDISIGRYKLVKAIKNTNPTCKLFCVGDDWQSIYRFSGSDISLFKDFEKYFGFTVKSKIETTYRFHHPLITLSSDFILKNPNQAKKELKSIMDNKTTTYKIHYSVNDNQDDTITIVNIFNEILQQYPDLDGKRIYILGRYGFDFNRIKNENSLLKIDRNNETIFYEKHSNGDIRTIKAQFMTVHKSKGLEAEIVIIINCNSGKYGFPSEMSDDAALNLLLSEADQFENGEERRLFYVAMTRAREQLYFVADSSYKSKFIAELEVNSGNAPNKKCPNCKTADIVVRKNGTAKNGNLYRFYGCTNYLYGCGYTNMEWENRN